MAANLKNALKIATLNVRGLASKRRQYQLSRILLENDIDIIAVQETKVESEQQTERMISPFRARYNVCVCHAVGTSGGCALLIRNSLGVCEENITVSEDGRMIVCDFVFCQYAWRIVCIYAPNKENERKRFFEDIEVYLRCDRQVILLGDFNCVCFAEDRVKKQPVREASALLLGILTQEHNLSDVGRVLSCGSFPHVTHFQNESHARLDRLYVSCSLIQHCNNYEVKNVSFSDHALVSIVVGIKKTKPTFNWNLWKLNAKLLSDEDFLAQVKEMLQKVLDIDNEDVVVKWEDFKNNVKIAAIERACVTRRCEKQKEKELHDQLDFFLNQESNFPGRYKKEIKQIKTELEIIDIEKYRGAMIRARAERLWGGETPTRRAFSDEKSYAKRNEIQEISYKNTVTGDSKIIEKAFVEYYTELLGLQKNVTSDYKSTFLTLLPQLEEDDKVQLEAPITKAEIETAIDELSTGKSPGPDGIHAAFYKAFRSETAEALYRVLGRAYECKELPLSFRKTHIVLIPKSEDPIKLQSVSAYRPISLTNVDYKIFMKVLARRLQTVIKDIVGPHQTCGIKGRTIFTNTHTARSILECIDAIGGRVAMLQLDLEKAFDRVAHEVLFCVLEHVNVGSVILDGVKMAYKQCSASVIVNKELSTSFPVLSSVKQGCPLSPLLFAMYLEPFCLKVLTNTRINGFKLHSTEVKILAYADDIAVFCTEQDSINEAVKDVTAFCKLSGSTINWNKCSGFWHGQWETTPPVYENVQWTVVPTRYLGVPLEHYRDPAEHWKEQIEQAREKTSKWGGRDMSVFTRATVCNLFIVAKVWYVLQVLCMARGSVQKLHRVFAVFLWGSTWERTSRTNLFRSVKNGGVGLAHLFMRQVVSRYIFLRDQNDLFLRTVVQVFLRDELSDFVVSSSDVTHNRVRGYLREVIDAFKFLKARFSIEYLGTVSRKQLYKDVLDVCLPEPLYRSLYRGEGGRDVLKRVKRMPVRPSVKSFFFQLHTGTLPVKPWLQEKGLFVAWSINCRICQKPETIDHIFLDCSDSVFHWDILKRTLKKDLVITPHSIRFLAIQSSGGVPYDMFVLLSLHSIWKTRMADRHAHVDAQPARVYFKESMVYIREIYRLQKEPPEWLPLLDNLVALKEF